MAGIAFDIKKLLDKKELSSVLTAFFYSGVVSSGPWLFAVFALGFISSFGKELAGIELINLFMGLIIYVFAFSMLLTYGTQMVITRYLSDCLYRKEDWRIPSLLITTILMLAGGAGLLYAPFVWSLELTFWVKVQSLFLFLLVNSMWAAMIYVSTLKAYKLVTITFISGFGISIPASLIIGNFYGLEGFLIGLNSGLTLIVFLLCAQIFKEFSGEIKFDWNLFKAHRQFPYLFFFGLFTGLGVWSDKLMFWFIHREPMGAGLLGYPKYDGAMFIGYMTVLPSLAYFILIAETDLYDNIRQYGYFVNNHSKFSSLEKARLNMIECLKKSFFKMGIIQGIFTIIVILAAPMIIQLLDMSILQISILRISMLGGYFQMGMMLLGIVLTYFTSERGILLVAFVFFSLNVICTWAFMNDFWLYGYGYFIASFVSFLVALLLVVINIKNFHYAMICVPRQ